MKLIIIDSEFMYKVNDIPFNMLDKVKVLIKNNNIYLKIKKELNELEMMNLLESSEIIHEKD